TLTLPRLATRTHSGPSGYPPTHAPLISIFGGAHVVLVLGPAPDGDAPPPGGLVVAPPVGPSVSAALPRLMVTVIVLPAGTAVPHGSTSTTASRSLPWVGCSTTLTFIPLFFSSRTKKSPGVNGVHSTFTGRPVAF